MRTRTALATVISVLLATSAPAQWPFGEKSGHGKKAQGGIVLRDGAEVYEKSEGDDVVTRLDRGDAVAGLHREAIVWVYEFVEEHDRVQVIFPKEGSRKPLSGWMDPDDLSSFTYDCGCEPECMPWSGSLGQTRWNPCFQEARDGKLDGLKVLWAEQKSRGSGGR